MIFQKSGLINKNQRGFTLIELIVAVAITGIIASGTATTIYQTVSGNASNSSHMTAIRQVQTTGYWISRDAQMAQPPVIVVDDGATLEVEILTLSWVGWEYDCDCDDDTCVCVDSHLVRYTYDADINELWRHEKITTDKYNDVGQFIDTTESVASTFIADHITLLTINWDEVDNKLTVTITASVTSWVGEAVEKRTYEITPRPSPSE